MLVALRNRLCDGTAGNRIDSPVRIGKWFAGSLCRAGSMSDDCDVIRIFFGICNRIRFVLYKQIIHKDCSGSPLQCVIIELIENHLRRTGARSSQTRMKKDHMLNSETFPVTLNIPYKVGCDNKIGKYEIGDFFLFYHFLPLSCRKEIRIGEHGNCRSGHVQSVKCENWFSGDRTSDSDSGSIRIAHMESGDRVESLPFDDEGTIRIG